MQIIFDLDEEQLKKDIANGLDRESIVSKAINQCRWEIDAKVLQNIKNSPEFKRGWSNDTDLIKVKDSVKQWVRESVESLIKKHVVEELKKSKIPNITKATINDILREYVDEQLVKTVKRTYNIAVDIKVNK